MDIDKNKLMSSSEKLKKERDKLLGYWFTFFFILSIVLAVVMPLERLMYFVGVQSFVDFVGHSIPMINNLAVNSAIPNVVKLYLAIMGLIFPIIFAIYLRIFFIGGRTDFQYRKLEEKLEEKPVLYFFAMIAAPFITVFAMNYFGTPGRVGWSADIDDSMRVSQLALGIYGAVLFNGLALFLAMSMMLFFGFIRVIRKQVKFWFNLRRK